MPAFRSLLLLLTAMSVVAGCKAGEKQEPAKRPNVVFVTVDTLRADRLGAYGFEQARTPHFDRLAREGVRVAHAIAATPITLPSHATLFTGLYPPAHGVRDNGRQRLPDEVVTLAERLKSEGYRTQAFVSAMVLHRRFNLSQGFDGYDDDLRRSGETAMFMVQERSGEQTIDRALAWLDQSVVKSEPYFLWVHLFDPHQPYVPPPQDAKQSPTLYDGEIASADRQVGRLIEALRTRGTLDDTVFVFTSDHGESLGEHGEATHAVFIYESTMHVPLIFRYPRKLPAGKVVSGFFRSVDVMPTLLGLLDLPPGNTQGADLAKALSEGDELPPLAPYSESLHSQFEFAMAPLFGIRSGKWTYVRAPRAELYDRDEDPGEVDNLLVEGSPSVVVEKATALDAEISKILKDSAQLGFVADANPLDEDTVKMLQALGYMGEEDDASGLEGMDPKDGVKAFDEIERARALVRDARYSEAKRVLRGLLDWIPTNAVARNLLAMCEYRTDNSAAAKQLYLQSLAYEPRQPEVLRQLSRIAIAEGDVAGGRAHALESIKVDPGDAEAMVILGYLDLKEGRPEDAKAWYRKAVEADPGYAESYVQFGNLHFRQRDFAEAKRWYERALQVDPYSFAAAIQAGTSALELRELEDAERFFLTASRIDAAAWRPFYNLACTRATAGDADGTFRYLRNARERGFKDANVLERSRCFAGLQSDPRFIELLGEL